MITVNEVWRKNAVPLHRFLIDKGIAYKNVSVVKDSSGLHCIFMKCEEDNLTDEIRKRIEDDGFDIWITNE